MTDTHGMLPDRSDLPAVSWTDPSQPPVGRDGQAWVWHGLDAQGGKRGGYVNPAKPYQSVHADLGHGEPHGPHWDYTDRETGRMCRLFPDGTVRPK